MADTIDPRAPQRIRHDTRMRLLQAIAVTDLTPKMRRVRFNGDMAGFASPGHADHIKAFFFPRGVEPKLVPIGPRGAEFAEGERPDMRDYTPRAWDVDNGWIDLDFVLHGKPDMVPLPNPVAEVCAVAKRDLMPGETFDAIGETCYRSYTMTITDSRAAGAVPVGLLEGGKVTAPVKKGELLTSANSQPDTSTRLFALRQAQDRMLGLAH